MEKKEQLQEIDPVTAITIATLVPLAIQLSMLFLLFTAIKNAYKEDKRLSKKIKSILKDGKDWKVMVDTKEKSPDAFCMVKPYIFISAGLIKIMNERELIAILLHESEHINNKDIWKKLGYESVFVGIILSTLLVISGPVGLALGMFAYFVLKGDDLLHIIMNVTLGRFAEKRADSFPVKFGYADDMISALEKLEKIYQRSLAKKDCQTVCKIMNKIDDALDEHPSTKTRVETILKKKEVWIETKSRSVIKLRNFFMKELGVKEK